MGEALAVVQADGSGDVVLEVQEIDGEQLKGRTVVTLQ